MQAVKSSIIKIITSSRKPPPSLKNPPGERFLPEKISLENCPLGKKSPGKNPPILKIFRSVFMIFELLSFFLYVIFKILLHSKLIFSLIELNLATLCNLVILKYFVLIF